MDVPRYQRITLGRRAFSIAGPTVWDLLPKYFRDIHTVTENIAFGQYQCVLGQYAL